MLRCIFFIILSALIAISNLADAGADFTNRADVQSFINKMVSKHQFKRDDLVWLFNRVTISSYGDQTYQCAAGSESLDYVSTSVRE